MTEKVQIVLICEDRQHSALMRRLLEAQGWSKHKIREQISPGGRGSAERWVRVRYAEEVRILRQKPHLGLAVVVVMDEDTQGALRREEQLASALAEAGLPPRSAGERILHVLPARNVETWIAYLRGVDVDEVTVYPKLERERECAPQVAALKAMCDARALRQPAPPSLERACREYRERL